jgi:hypothetical protein
VKSAGEGGNQTTRMRTASTDAEKAARLRRDITAVLNLRVLCPGDAEEMADALGLSGVAQRIARVETSLEAPVPVGGGRR